MESALKGWTTAALSVSVLILSVLVLGITTGSVYQSQTSTPAPTSTRITIFPSELDLNPGQKTQLAVFLEAGQPVTAVELHLSFVPGILEVSKLLPGDFFAQTSVLEEEIDNRTGRAKIILGGLSGRRGSGQLAFVEVEAGDVGETKLRVASETKVAATGEDDSVLGDTLDALIRVTNNE